VVLLETNARIQYFVKTFGISPAKFRRIWLGADDEIMYPRTEVAQSSEFSVFFYGGFVPLQGIEYIIEAAKILETRAEPVRFTIVGSGLTYSRMRETAERLGVKTVAFLGWVPYENLPILMSQSHVCLGIFGTPPTTQRVILNKVFDALAVRRAVITADTLAIGEAGLVHGEHLWLCAAGSGEALADAIVKLKHDTCLRETIAENGYRYFCSHFSIDVIAKEMVPVIREVLGRGREQG
jgi:glycosyltransferase involved in cell wall biosynthesis